MGRYLFAEAYTVLALLFRKLSNQVAGLQEAHTETVPSISMAFTIMASTHSFTALFSSALSGWYMTT